MRKYIFFHFIGYFVLKAMQIYGELLLNLHYSFYGLKYSVNGVHESNLIETILKSHYTCSSNRMRNILLYKQIWNWKHRKGDDVNICLNVHPYFWMSQSLSRRLIGSFFYQKRELWWIEPNLKFSIHIYC